MSNNIRLYFDKKKPTIILFKKDLHYEIICNLYRDTGEKSKQQLEMFFSNIDSEENILNLFIRKVRKILNNCQPKNSIDYSSIDNMTYKNYDKRLHTNNNIIKIINELNSQVPNSYTIKYQIVGPNGKVTHICIHNKKNKPYIIPCYPSYIMTDIEVKHYVSKNNYTTIINTIEGLMEFYNATSEVIQCKPVSYVLSDNKIVGIKTDTNLFVPISKEILLTSKEAKNITKYNLKEDTNGDVFISDNVWTHIDEELFKYYNEREDEERILNNYKIIIEDHSYYYFRNKVRNDLNKLENKEKKNKLQEQVLSNVVLYQVKMLKIQNIVKSIIDKYYKFVDYYTDENIVSLRDNYYLLNDKSKNKVYIPKINLITGNNNKDFYIKKLSDELIRNVTVQQYFFEIQKYLVKIQHKYNINKDELLIPQSLITREYLDELYKSNITNNKENIYDNTEPLKTKLYNNEIKIKPTKRTFKLKTKGGKKKSRKSTH